MLKSGQKQLQLATLHQAPLCFPLAPVLKITAALSALLAHFFPDLTDFQKHQSNGAELRRQKQD